MVHRLLLLLATSRAIATRPTLEDLAFFYGTDKSHDDHKYTDLCTPLSAPTRPLARCYA